MNHLARLLGAVGVASSIAVAGCSSDPFEQTLVLYNAGDFPVWLQFDGDLEHRNWLTLNDDYGRLPMSAGCS